MDICSMFCSMFIILYDAHVQKSYANVVWLALCRMLTLIWSRFGSILKAGYTTHMSRWYPVVLV